MPTVGVHADDASGKKSASMQKHFRHLVNETASKQRFLRSLHKTNSAKEGSGSLPTNLKQDSSIKTEPAINEATDSHDCHGQAQGQQDYGRGAPAVNVKLEEVVEQEPQDHPSENPGPKSSHVARLDAADSACLPDSLGEELGDAACLKADPDSLMADASQPSTAPPATLSAAGNPPAIDAKQAVDRTRARQAPADHTEVVQQFLNILGDAVDADIATDYVCRAGGHLSAAINSYYDNADLLLGSTAKAAAHVSDAGQASSSETSAESAAHSLAQSADRTAPGSAARKPASQQPSGKQVGKGKKRTATATAQVHGVDKPAKKQRPAPSAQRSIATFFGTGQPSAKSGKQGPIESVGPAPDLNGVQAQQGVESPQRMVTAPQQGVAHPLKKVSASQEVASLHKDTAVASGGAGHEDAVDLAGDSMEDEDVREGAVKQAAPPTGFQAVSDPSHESAEAPSDHDDNESIQVKDTAETQQPVHPFFGKGTRPAKKAPAKAHGHSAAVEADLMSAKEGKSSVVMPSAQPKCEATDPEGKGSLLKQEPPRRNPFQKAQPEPEKDVPADAVLLPTSEYDPVKMAVWEAGQATPYRHISRAFQAMESTTKRLRIGDAIANMFRSILALSPGKMLFCLQPPETSSFYGLSVCLKVGINTLLYCCLQL